jgi:hypothetical protein
LKGHADAETLAAFREELLSRRKAARVSAHLAACSRCAELDAQLTEVSALLTTSAAPPMPDALTARIEAAIAAEAAARSATAVDGGVAAADGGVPVGAARAGAGPHDRAARPSRPAGGPGRSRLALRVAAVAAAFAVVAGGGYGAARLLSGSPEATSSAGSGSVGAPAFRENTKAPPEPSGALRAPGGQAGSGSSSFHPLVVSSGTNYQPGQLEAQVSTVLTQHGAHAATSSGPSSGGQHAASVAPPPACVLHVTGGKPALLVDQAKYQGRPATIIVIPGATSGTLRALVVGGRCQATTGHVLAITTFPGSG